MNTDSKSRYSDEAKKYITQTVPKSDIDMRRVGRALIRKEKYNENWSKQKVNINEIVAKFTPDCQIKFEGGIKVVYYNDKYAVKADMVCGYLRIYDKKLKSFVKLDGTPSDDKDETHFKIKKKEEM